jgi:hypothetical protein
MNPAAWRSSLSPERGTSRRYRLSAVVNDRLKAPAQTVGTAWIDRNQPRRKAGGTQATTPIAPNLRADAPVAGMIHMVVSPFAERAMPERRTTNNRRASNDCR